MRFTGLGAKIRSLWGLLPSPFSSSIAPNPNFLARLSLTSVSPQKHLFDQGRAESIASNIKDGFLIIEVVGQECQLATRKRLLRIPSESSREQPWPSLVYV